MPERLVLSLGPLALAIAFHGYRLLSVAWAEDLVESRVRLSLFAAGAVSLWALRSGRTVFRSALGRAAAGLVAGVVIWSAVLDAALGGGVIYARGTLWILSGASIHALTAWVTAFPDAVRSLPGRYVARIGLLACCVLINVSLVETVSRWIVPIALYDPVPDEGSVAEAFHRDGNGRVAGRPGFRGQYMHPEFPGIRVDLDDRGFRDGLDESNPPEEPWVMVVGDSFVFGCGVVLEDTFQEQLEARLSDLDDPPQLMAAAVPGYGQVQERDLMDSLLEEGLRPKVVVLAIYEGNDLEDNINAGAIEAGIREAPPSSEGDGSPRSAGAVPGVARRYLIGLGHAAFWRGSSVAVQMVLPRIEGVLVKLGWIEPFVASNQMLAYTMVRESPEPILIALHWTRLLVGQVEERCRAIDASLVVLMVPAAIQAEPKRYDQFLAQVTEKDRYAFDRTATHDRLVESLRGDGITVVDPLAALSKDAVENGSTYHREGHWNRRGHSVAADVLEPVLRGLLTEQR